MCELSERIGENGGTPLALLYFARGETARGLEIICRGLEVAETTGDAKQLAAAHLVAGVLANSAGHFATASLHLGEAIRYAGRADLKFTPFGLLYKSGVGVGLAVSLQQEGRPSEAAKMFDETLRQTRDSRHLFSLAFVLTLGGCGLYHDRRQPEIVRVYSEEAVALSAENGFTDWVNQARFYHGWALADLGQLDQGIGEMEAAIVGFRGTLATTIWPQYANALLAHVYARMGRAGEALTMLDDVLLGIEETGAPGAKAEIQRLKGKVLLMHDKSAVAEAESCFRAALEVARAQEAKWWELRSSVSLARLLRDTNRCDDARAMVAEIYNWFSQGFELPDLKEAKALLDELS